MTKKLRCGECGSSRISLSNVRGEKFPYKSFPSVILNTDLELCACEDCGNIILTNGDSDKLDEAIESSLRNYCKDFIANILDKTGWSQLELADFIGFTPNYLSNIKNGKIPEFRTFNYLKVLSQCYGAIECVIWDDPRCSDVRDGYQFIGEVSSVSRVRAQVIDKSTNESVEDFPLAA